MAPSTIERDVLGQSPLYVYISGSSSQQQTYPGQGASGFWNWWFDIFPFQILHTALLWNKECSPSKAGLIRETQLELGASKLCNGCLPAVRGIQQFTLKTRSWVHMGMCL